MNKINRFTTMLFKPCLTGGYLGVGHTHYTILKRDGRRECLHKNKRDENPDEEAKTAQNAFSRAALWPISLPYNVFLRTKYT